MHKAHAEHARRDAYLQSDGKRHRYGNRLCRQAARRCTRIPREDEAFYVLRGEVVIKVESAIDPLRRSPGGFLFAPRNRRHAYRNIGTVAAHLLVFAIPGTGLNYMFAAFDAARKYTAHIPTIDTIAAIAEQ